MHANECSLNGSSEIQCTNDDILNLVNSASDHLTPAQVAVQLNVTVRIATRGLRCLLREGKIHGKLVRSHWFFWHMK